MADKTTSLPVNIQDDEDGYNAKVDSDGELNSKAKIWDGTNEVTVTGNKLDVNASVSFSWDDTNKVVPWNGTYNLDIDSNGYVTSNQGGTWNINNISGTVSLPTGASTLSEQQTQTTKLTSIDGKDFSTETTLAAFKTENDSNLDTVNTNLNNIETNQTDGTQETQLTDGTHAVTVTNNKLDVNASSTPALYSQLVYQYETFSTAQNKIEYTVPTGKELYIVFISITGRSSTIDVEWQEDATSFTAMSISGTNGTPTVSFSLPGNAPFGPFSAGTEIRARRIAGDTNKQWSATMVGYLVDV